MQPKSLKSITTRHDGTKRNTRNTTQINKTQYMQIVPYAKSITTRHGSVGSVVPLVLLGSVGFRWIPLFLGVPFFLWVPLGSVVSVSPVAPLFRWVPLGSVGFRWVPLFRWVPCSVGLRCSVGSFVPLVCVGFRWFRWVLLFPLVPLFCSYKSIPTRHDGNTTQHNTKNKSTENEEVGGRGGSL